MAELLLSVRRLETLTQFFLEDKQLAHTPLSQFAQVTTDANTLKLNVLSVSLT